jgi:hypothetical protein
MNVYIRNTIFRKALPSVIDVKTNCNGYNPDGKII